MVSVTEVQVPSQPGYETWLFTLEDGGEPVGSLKLSRAFGEVFGHDLDCPQGADRLIYAALKRAKSWGAAAINVHVDSGTSPGSAQMWRHHGFSPAIVVLRREL